MYELFVWKLIKPFEMFQIGVEGGVIELINHFENDVFGRQNELIKKCQHHQKIIDNYVEGALEGCTVKNQYVAKQNTKEDNLTSQRYKRKDENTVIKKNPAEMENIIEQVADDIQQTLEFNVDNMLIEANNINTEMENLEHASCLENSNVEIKTVDTEKKIIDNKTMSQILQFDLLKPIVIEPIDYKPESILYKTPENTTDIQMHKRQNVFSNRSVFILERFGQPNLAETPTESELMHMKNKKIAELKLLNELSKSVCIPKSQKLNKHAVDLLKELGEFDKDYQRYKACKGINYSSNSSAMANTSSNKHDGSTFSHKKNIVNDGASTSKQNQIVQNISCLNDTDNTARPRVQYCSVIDGLLNKLK